MYYNENNQTNSSGGPVYETTHYRVENVSQPKKKGTGKLVALCLACALVGGLAGGAGVALGGQKSVAASGTVSLQSDRINAPVNVTSVNGGRELTMAEIYAANLDSVVGITVDTLVGVNIYGQQVTNAASGSGFVLTTDGYIVTNHHVIENATSIKVSFADGTVYDGTLVGSDSENDIAVVKINASGLKPVVIGDSKSLNVGEAVTAIGNPLGQLSFTQTHGIVSGLNREVTMSDSTVMNLLQTDCPINSGNSGGPLFNTYGEVIGIVNAKYSSSGGSGRASVDNIGFAIPISNVYDMLQEIIETGFVSKPYLGITVRTITSELQQYNLPAGAGVETVTAGSCAQRAGLKAGDVITAVDGEAITTKEELISAKESRRVGDTMTLTVSRGGETLTISVVLEEQPAAAAEPQTTQQVQQQQPSQGYEYYYNPYNWFNWF